MTDTAHSGSSEPDRLRNTVLEAAVAELVGKKLARFSLEGVAARAGVPERLVREIWANTPDLLSATLRTFGERRLPIPDTGSLRGDLLAYARAYAATVNTPEGRRVLDSLIVRPSDWEMPGPRTTFLESRVSRIGVIVSRAVQRGECPPDTDPARFIDHVGLGLCLPVLWYDRPVTDEDCEYVVDLLVNGIAPRA